MKHGRTCKEYNRSCSIPLLQPISGKKKASTRSFSACRNDLILAQITSRDVCDQYAISITDSDLDQGNLIVEINIRPNRLFTADRSIVLDNIARLKQEEMSSVISKIIEIIQN